MHVYQAGNIRIRSAHRGIKTNARHTTERTTEGEEQQGKRWATREPSSRLLGAALVTSHDHVSTSTIEHKELSQDPVDPFLGKYGSSYVSSSNHLLPITCSKWQYLQSQWEWIVSFGVNALLPVCELSAKCTKLLLQYLGHAYRPHKTMFMCS